MAIDRPGFQPSHPGRVLRRNLEGLGMTQETFAEWVGLSRQTVSAIIAGRSSVTAEVAARFARAFGTTTQFWLSLQGNHDAWAAEAEPNVRAIKFIGAAKKRRASTMIERTADTGRFVTVARVPVGMARRKPAAKPSARAERAK